MQQPLTVRDYVVPIHIYHPAIKHIPCRPRRTPIGLDVCEEGGQVGEPLIALGERADYGSADMDGGFAMRVVVMLRRERTLTVFTVPRLDEVGLALMFAKADFVVEDLYYKKPWEDREGILISTHVSSDR